MIQLQVISKVLQSKNMEFLQDNFLTPEYFVGYEEEISFIYDHFRDFGNVPDKATFLAKFPDIDLVEVTESDKYLADTLREEYLYYQSIPVVQQVAKLLKSDANAAVAYMLNAVKELEPAYGIQSTDLVKQADERKEQYDARKAHEDEFFYTTGFKELDDILGGLEKVAEFLVIVARINMGKSWVLEKIAEHIFHLGANVGYISPEMNETSIGYRFDTLTGHFSNKALMRGKEVEGSYDEYIEQIKQEKHKFLVATPKKSFGRVITVSKLRAWIKQEKLDFVAIDGITYLADERAQRGDNKTTSLTNISEDLMSLSEEMGIPIAVVVQANRSAIDKDNPDAPPDLENIKDCDGIGANASKVVGMKQLKNGVLRLVIRKHRFGVVGGQLDYAWEIDKGEFKFLPNTEDAEPAEETERKTKKIKKQYQDKEDVF